MTASADAESFGPYAFTLSAAETEAAAARFGLRAALRGGLIARHLAPLAAFALILLYASMLALTGFIGRRAGEATILLAAAAFMIQRLATHWRICRARNVGRTAIASVKADGALTARIDEGGVTLEGGGRSRRLDYADCEEAEDAGGLIYLWPRHGVPIVLPARALGDGEALRLVAQIKRRIGGKRPF
jgi:hypothetical protein